MKLREYDYSSFDGARVFSDVMNGDIGVVHNVLTENEARAAVAAALSFAQAIPAFDTKDGTASPKLRENFHRVDNDPVRSKTKHLFHTFNFEDVLSIANGDPIVKVFNELLSLDNELMGKRGDFSTNGPVNFHPQMIHYPKGGGFFDRHTHGLDPQKIGLIASLTKKGEHFEKGGTLFWGADGEIDAEPAQTIGSVTLFRFDLPHAVSRVDQNAALSFGKPDGRWVAVLPYRAY
jgi:hypothetical protein